MLCALLHGQCVQNRWLAHGGCHGMFMRFIPLKVLWLTSDEQIFFTLYATFSTLGVTIGTGRHHADLETEQVYSAMMVRDTVPNWCMHTLTMCLVLVVLLPLVLPHHDFLQALHRILPPTSHDGEDSTHHHLPRHVLDRLVRRHFLFRHRFPMSSRFVFLGQGTRWYMHWSHSGDRTRRPLQYFRCRIWLCFRASSWLHCLESSIAQEDKVLLDSSSRHGLRVSLMTSSF